MTNQGASNFGLTERDMLSIREILGQFPEIRLVLIFGSRAKGSSRQGSDVDLALMDPDIPDATILRLKNAFEESSLPYNVDLVHYPSLQHAGLKAHIDRVGKMIYLKI